MTLCYTCLYMNGRWPLAHKAVPRRTLGPHGMLLQRLQAVLRTASCSSGRQELFDIHSSSMQNGTHGLTVTAKEKILSGFPSVMLLAIIFLFY